jgi:DNA polymerase
MLFIDLETRSRASLRDVGVYRYVEGPDFAILLTAWAIDDGEVQVTTRPAVQGSLFEGIPQ